MSRIYSLPTFFRMVPHSMLKTFFEKRQIDTTDIPWAFLKQREIQPLLQWFRELPRETQVELEGIFQEIFELACESGFELLWQAADVFNEHLWLNCCPQKTSFYAAAFGAWSAYRTMFDYALALHRTKGLSWWRKREGLPKYPPLWNEEIKETLELSLENYFVETQNRGNVCTVEMQSFDEITYYFFAYPDDYVRSFQQHDPDGNLKARRTRPTFVVVFAYNSEEGTLEIHVSGSEKMKKKLEEIFLETIVRDDFEITPDQPYDLSVILQDDFSLASDPEDCVTIELKELELYWRGIGSYHFRPDPGAKLFEELKAGLRESRLPWDQAVVKYVKFQFTFYPRRDEKGGTLTFEISVPHHCTLRGQNPRRIELIRKYLKARRIEHENTYSRNTVLLSPQ